MIPTAHGPQNETHLRTVVGHPAGGVLGAAAPVLRLQRPGADGEEPDRRLRPRDQRDPQPRRVLYGAQEDARGPQRNRRAGDALAHVVHREPDPGVAGEAVRRAEARRVEEARIAAPLRGSEELAGELGGMGLVPLSLPCGRR